MTLKLVFRWSIRSRTFFSKKHAGNGQQRLVPDLFIILINNLKQPLHSGNSFKSKIF